MLANKTIFDATQVNEAPKLLLNAKSKIDNEYLVLRSVSDATQSGFTITGNWSVDPTTETVVIDALNCEPIPITLNVRFESDFGDEPEYTREQSFVVRISSKDSLKAPLLIPIRLPQLADTLIGMHRFPGGEISGRNGRIEQKPKFAWDAISSVTVYTTGETLPPAKFGIKSISIRQKETAGIGNYHEALTWLPEKFYPMIDKFGQYKHVDWFGKVHSLEELRQNIAVEDENLKNNPAPADWNRFGGWKNGPKFNATGHFRIEKIDGKWWLIDPDGSLFWSHGCTSVRFEPGKSGITDREYMFEEFPTDAFASSDGAAVNYYVGMKDIKTFDFGQSNLELKYGNDWKKAFVERAHRRIPSWGMNTLGNWSEVDVTEKGGTPYTATISVKDVPNIKASNGYWGKFRDPYHPQFRASYSEAIQKSASIDTDPWCVGVFVDNELSWGNGTSLAVAALCSDHEQPAKIALIDWLKNKYVDIAKLNEVWGSNYTDWNTMLTETLPPDAEKANADLREMYALIAEKYFSIIHEELKKSLPNKLYLGCRFAASNPTVIQIAAKYNDVLSFNEYRLDLDGFRLPLGIDKAVIIGEFHFGALDRGVPHDSMRGTANQDARAAAYRRYMISALEHPAMVGAHWFRYQDQPTAGRTTDGKNGQNGVLDICDTPYAETIDAFRRIGASMYLIRSGNFTKID